MGYGCCAFRIDFRSEEMSWHIAWDPTNSEPWLKWRGRCEIIPSLHSQGSSSLGSCPDGLHEVKVLHQAWIRVLAASEGGGVGVIITHCRPRPLVLRIPFQMHTLNQCDPWGWDPRLQHFAMGKDELSSLALLWFSWAYHGAQRLVPEPRDVSGHSGEGATDFIKFSPRPGASKAFEERHSIVAASGLGVDSVGSWACFLLCWCLLQHCAFYFIHWILTSWLRPEFWVRNPMF